MIIDIVKSKGVPFKCNNCNTYFAWKPDEQGECSVRIRHYQCKKVECEYYVHAKMQKCPECGSNDCTKVPAIVYKIMREIRR